MPSRQDPPFPHTLGFSFGTALPAESEVAQLVVSLAAVANDLVLVQKLWFSANETDLQLSRELDHGESFYMFRLTLSTIWEAHLLLKAAHERPTTADFLGGLPPEADAARARVQQAVDALESDRYRGVVPGVRNTTWHFPKPGERSPGKSLAPTLATLAKEDAQGSITQSGPTVGEIRYSFADEVLYRMAFSRVNADLADYQSFINDVALPASTAMIDLTRLAVVEYFRAHAIGGDATASPS